MISMNLLRRYYKMTFKKGDIIYLRDPQTMLCPTGYNSIMHNAIRDTNPISSPTDLYDKLYVIKQSYSNGDEVRIYNNEHNNDKLLPSYNDKIIRTSINAPFPTANVFGLLYRPQDLHYEQLLATKISKRNLSWKAFKKLTRQSDT